MYILYLSIAKYYIFHYVLTQFFSQSYFNSTKVSVPSSSSSTESSLYIYTSIDPKFKFTNAESELSVLTGGAAASSAGVFRNRWRCRGERWGWRKRRRRQRCPPASPQHPDPPPPRGEGFRWRRRALGGKRPCPQCTELLKRWKGQKGPTQGGSQTHNLATFNLFSGFKQNWFLFFILEFTKVCGENTDTRSCVDWSGEDCWKELDTVLMWTPSSISGMKRNWTVIQTLDLTSAFICEWNKTPAVELLVERLKPEQWKFWLSTYFRVHL